jgi:uncharacterized protein with HEPN domain
LADPCLKLLRDILDAGAAIASFVEQRSLDDYRQQLLLRSAVERQFEIVGEALRRLEAADTRVFARISEARRIIAFRNLIAHGYDGVDAAIVWQAITDKLPVLMAEAEALLDELGRAGD